MILLRNCKAVFTGRKSNDSFASRECARASCLFDVDILIDGPRIVRIGPTKSINPHEGLRVIDASRHVVLPGLVNTHHHFYQTLTRALPAVQSAKLFDWLVALYEIWKGIDADSVYWSSKLAMAELIKTGCTTSSDHHYLYPRNVSDDIPSIQFEAASELGMRFAPTRGSMSLSKKDGGLPPDSVVQDEDTIYASCENTIARFHDASSESMRRVALAPCSPFSVSEASLSATAQLARTKNARLHIHLAETADENEYCLAKHGVRPLALMERNNFVGPDVWYAHGIFFNDEEMSLLAKTGTGIAHCPSSNMRLGSGIARVREMLDARIPVGLAVDGSASNDSSDMLGEARQALLLQRVRYGADGLSTTEALALASEGGARILGWDKLGRIEEGWLADLALFEIDRLEYAGAMEDPASALILCGYDHGADYVIINGKLALDHRRLVGIDEEKLKREAEKASRSLLAKADL